MTPIQRRRTPRERRLPYIAILRRRGVPRDPDSLRDASQRDAERAVLGALTGCGSGSYRDVYANTRRTVVYKVPIDDPQDSRSGNWANESEHEACTRYRDMGKTWAPPTRLFYVTGDRYDWDTGERYEASIAVLAMPFYPGDPDEWAHMDSRRAALRDLRRNDYEAECLDDMHSGNYRFTRHEAIRITDIQDLSRSWS